MPPNPTDDDEICGETFDHDEVITYDDPDRLQWECRRCGAEVFEEKEKIPPSMIAWLRLPVGNGTLEQAKRVMCRVDQTGTSDRSGRGGWDDVEPIPVGDIAPDDGWYQIGRRDLPAIGHGDDALGLR